MGTENNGITVQGLLTVVFITLKLTGVITWSWWWVLSPLWIPWVVYILMGIVFLVTILVTILIGTVVLVVTKIIEN